MLCIFAEHAVEPYDAPVGAPSQTLADQELFGTVQSGACLQRGSLETELEGADLFKLVSCRARGACSSSCGGAEPAGGAGRCQAARV